MINKKLVLSLAISFVTFLNLSNSAIASPGRTNKEGCHTDKNGYYHCHKKEEENKEKNQD